MLSSLIWVAPVLLSGAPIASIPVPADQPVHLGITLKLTHLQEMETLRAAQVDPRSPQFRAWLTPQEFGARFGQSAETYHAFSQWLTGSGLKVTEAPNRAFIEATGSAAQVEAALAIRFAPIEGDASPAVHTYVGKPRFPAQFGGMVLHVSGLDTRVMVKHYILAGIGNLMGPQDLRHFYDVDPLFAAGFVGQGQKTAVLSTAETAGNGANPDDINYFFRSVSDSKATFVNRVLSNPAMDFDPQPGAGIEFDLDCEMHSVGAPGADSITLVVAPASEVFTTGAQDIANNLPDVTTVSISLGVCEKSQQQQDATQITTLRQTVIQGTMEGQTWFAASGDNGANDCMNGSLGVDFPSIIPEMMAAGGSEVKQATFDANHAIMAYEQEVAWNDGAMGGAAGGGISTIFPQPTYQAGLAVSDAGRSVPDIAMMAGLPGVAMMSSSPPGVLSPVEGTSIASPLSAGMFALIASRVGCRLGDVHATLYALGAAQQDGGPAVFHDLVSGNLTLGGVTGPSAGPGFDSATGWGSLDLAAIAAAWPACPAPTDGGVASDGGTPVAPYDACAYVCDAGMTCTKLTEGPVTCSQICSIGDAGTCPAGEVCNSATLYAMGSNGSCVVGCASDNDCTAQTGTVCSLCSQSCVTPGNATGKIGDACTNDSACPTGATCQANMFLPGGYCTLPCQPGDTGVCSCPTGSGCTQLAKNFMPTDLCLERCTQQSDCTRPGYVCQPGDTSGAVCLPPCQILMGIDICTFVYDTTKACDTVSGVCGGLGAPDAGQPDAGQPDAGQADAGPADSGMNMDDAGMGVVNLPAVPTDIGKQTGGCGCNDTGPLPFGLLALLALGARRRKS